MEYGTFGQGLDAEATAPGKEALVLIGYDNNKTGKESKSWNALYVNLVVIYLLLLLLMLSLYPILLKEVVVVSGV